MLDYNKEMQKYYANKDKYPFGYSEGAFNEGIGIDEYNDMMNESFNFKFM